MLDRGASNLILDCCIVKGNPADTDLAIPMLERQKEIYGYFPLKVCFDGGFASKENLKKAKGFKIKDVCFAKKRGLEKQKCAAVSMCIIVFGGLEPASRPGYRG